jgi:hypothetical protein
MTRWILSACLSAALLAACSGDEPSLASPASNVAGGAGNDGSAGDTGHAGNASQGGDSGTAGQGQAGSGTAGGGQAGGGTAGGGQAGGGTAGSAGGTSGLRADWKALAGQYLEARSDAWITSPPSEGNIKCAMSCHTTYPYMLARSALGPAVATPIADKARGLFAARVAEGDSATPFYGNNGDAKTHESAGTESLLNAAALAVDDRWSGKPLSAEALAAVDRMWGQQQDSGTWDWLQFNLEPWETRDDYAVVTGLLVASLLPDGASPGQVAGVQKLAARAQTRVDAMALHDRVALLWVSGNDWAGASKPEILTAAQRSAIAAEIVARQLPDGGFSAGGWGSGSRAASIAGQSDGYATALATLALCREPGHKEEVSRGLSWLASHQADDGSWPGQSVNSDYELTRTFMTDASTAYAVLALARCGGN